MRRASTNSRLIRDFFWNKAFVSEYVDLVLHWDEGLYRWIERIVEHLNFELTSAEREIIFQHITTIKQKEMRERY